MIDIRSRTKKLAPWPPRYYIRDEASMKCQSPFCKAPVDTATGEVPLMIHHGSDKWPPSDSGSSGTNFKAGEMMRTLILGMFSVSRSIQTEGTGRTTYDLKPARFLLTILPHHCL